MLNVVNPEEVVRASAGVMLTPVPTLWIRDWASLRPADCSGTANSRWGHGTPCVTRQHRAMEPRGFPILFRLWDVQWNNPP